ncbi:MAG: GntR family transcriptional regulator [bacterium]|nr:GntR family transcriptional regulator [bacterium]
MGEKTPIYEGLKQELKGRIERGELKEGARVPSELELASQLGVNRSQTRLALRELQLEGYIVRKQGSGSYVAPQPNRVSPVRVGDSRAVAIVISQEVFGHSLHITQGFIHRASEEGLQVITYNLNQQHTDDAAEVRFLRSVIDSGVSGVVAWVGHDTGHTHDYVRELADRRFPIVLVDRYLPEVETDFVVSDNEALGYELTNALLALGHKRIAFAGIEHPTPSSVQDRYAGYRRALEEASIPFDERLVMDLNHVNAMRRDAVKSVMALAESPTAFACIHLGPVQLLIEPLKELGYCLSENVDIAAVDDHYEGLPELPLIRMRQQGYDIGMKSAELLLTRMEEPDRAAERCFVSPRALNDTGTHQPVHVSTAS